MWLEETEKANIWTCKRHLPGLGHVLCAGGMLKVETLMMLLVGIDMVSFSVSQGDSPDSIDTFSHTWLDDQAFPRTRMRYAGGQSFASEGKLLRN